MAAGPGARPDMLQSGARVGAGGGSGIEGTPLSALGTSPTAYLPAWQGQPARGTAPSSAPALFPDPSNRSLNLPVPGARLRMELVIIHPVPGLLRARVALSPVPVVLQERASLFPCP